MRIRTIKPDFWESESLGRISRNARLLFIGLWNLADDSSRAREHSRYLANTLFPYDEDALELIPSWLAELEAEGCIVRYQVNGSHYLYIPNFLKHQKIDRPSKSKYPDPSEVSTNTREGGGKGVANDHHQDFDEGTNHPELKAAQAHFTKCSDYTKDEVRITYAQFEAAKDEVGQWYWGKRPVGDWRSAMEVRLSENRTKTERFLGTDGKRPITAAEALRKAVRDA